MRPQYRRKAGRIIALALALTMLFAPEAFAATRYSTLEFGSRGSDVLKLQKALIQLGFDPSGTDGKFGRGTEAAVIQYQASKGLTADGKAGSLTLNALYTDAAASTATTDSGTDTGTTATGTNPNTLQYGNSGDRVTELQTALTKLGYDTDGVDGRFGAGTRKAVVAFQKAMGLTADGLAGSKTQNLLYSKANETTGDTGSSGTTGDSGASSADGSFTRTLRRGYTGNDVLSVQTQLQSLGYYTSTLDGVYGAGTMAAVSAFQKNNSLSVDGLVGSKTYTRMFASGAVASGGSASGGTDTSTDSGSSGTDTSSGAYTSLALGATGTAVKNMQKALKDLGYNVSTDGNFGAQTKMAVTAFQKLNGLTADGVAGALTQEKLYSGSAKAYDSSADTSVIITDDTGKASGPSTSSVKCMYWFTEVKPTIRSGQYVTIFDPATSLQWTLRLYSLGHHADSEPVTATDTAIMYKAFGYTNTWTPKPVYVQLPNGTWTLATMHNVPHLNGSISTNDFDGHLCVHFLRTLEECAANDPDYGMTHQRAIRKKWKEMTGIDITD